LTLPLEGPSGLGFAILAAAKIGDTLAAMAVKPNRLVYSTESAKNCPRCGWPSRDCRCGTRPDEPVPARITAKLRLEKSGRGGKTVTVVDGLPKNRELLKQLASELKQACGTGGTTGEAHVEIQGDQREAIRALLTRKDWMVKG
jgi:translation initiation factor 1